MKNIRPFRFWCQKVLPLVYDDSLSYYELLCKVVAKLNEVISNENELNEAFQQLKEWIENWVDTQDFQKMIDDKLDEMVKDGTFDKLINQEIFGDLNEKVNNNTTNITNLTTKVNQNTTDVSGLKTRMNGAESDITAQGNRISKLEGLWLNGKSAVFFGDSLTYGELVGTGGQQSPDNYPATFGKITGCNVTNYGHSGDKAVDCLAVIRSHADELVNYDYIFVNIGVNDFMAQTPVGWLDCLDENYFNGQINAIFNALQNGRGGKTQIIALSFMPNHEMWNEWYGKVSWLTYKANYDYCATVSGIQIINMAKAAGINNFNSGKYMNADGLHFTNDGYALLGKTIAACMMSGYYYDIKVGMSENQIKPWSFVNNYTFSKNFGTLSRNGMIDVYDKKEHSTINQFAYLAEEFSFMFSYRGEVNGTIGIGFPGYAQLGKIQVQGNLPTTPTYLIKTKNTIGENTYLGWSIQLSDVSGEGKSAVISNLCLKYGPGEYPGYAEENHYDVNISFETGVSSDKMPCRVIQKDFEIQLNGYFYNTQHAIAANTNILNLNGFPWTRRQNTCKTYLVYCGGNDGKMYVFDCESGYLKNLTEIPQGVIIGLNAVLYL